MAKASDNAFPSVILVPTTAAAVTTPPTGQFRIFLDSADGNKQKRMDSARAVTLVEGGTGGSGGTGDVTSAQLAAVDASAVHKTGTLAETVTGVKTFSASPVVPEPTTAVQAASKQYVDARVVSDYVPALLRYDTGASSYPVRSTATSSPSRTVIWVGPIEPTVGGNYAVSGIDIWWKTA